MGATYEQLNKEKNNIKNMTYLDYMKISKKKYYDNLYKSNNINIALDKKSFDKAKTIRNNINLEKKLEKNDWKDFILTYFYIEFKRSNILWFENIIERFLKTNFLSEIKYQSLMFYNDFDMITKPKIFDSIDEKINSINFNIYNEMNKIASFDMYEKEDEINENVINTNDVNSSNKSKINLTGITEVLGGSFKVNYSFNESDSNIDTQNYKNIRNRIKKILKIIKQHLYNSDHPISMTIQIFEEEISKFISQKIEEIKSKPNYKNVIKNFNIEIVKIIKNFILNCQTAIKLFYYECVNLKCFIEEKDEMINLTTSVLFKIGNLYKNICKLFSIEIEDEIYDLKIRLKYLNNIENNEISIPCKFALDETTDELKQELIKKYEEKNNIKFQIKEEQNKFHENNPYIKNFNKNKKIKGYDTVIQIIKYLNINESPFEKMMLIASVSTEITNCINKYWKGMDDCIDPFFLVINADELMSLFINLLIKSEMPEILLHEKIIDEFTTRTTKASMIGYYNTTFDAAIKYIQKNTLKDKNEIINKEINEIKEKEKLNYNEENKNYINHLINKNNSNIGSEINFIVDKDNNEINTHNINNSIKNINSINSSINNNIHNNNNNDINKINNIEVALVDKSIDSQLDND